jgi:hypothetical protein
MIIDKIPEIRALSREEMSILTQELLNELNAPKCSDEQDRSILDVLNQRFADFQEDPKAASSWSEVRERLQHKTGDSWRK